MLFSARTGLKKLPFHPVQADMVKVPFRDGFFDKSVSITALEFIEDARSAVNELFRITRPGGTVIVATLNSLSPWATRRSRKTEGHILENAFYRSPADLIELTDLEAVYETSVHFLKDDEPEKAIEIEKEGRAKKLDSGAFVIVRWRKPL
jgi:ubiquinone/menaquinone biosynthesis C-methylase UbiE